jgi:peptidoglycan/LPS O-acetylase OafA/YrhL
LTIAFWLGVRALDLQANDAPDLSLACIAHNALLLNGFSSCGNGMAINGVSWSIGVEMALYLLFPLTIPLARRRGLLEGGFLVCLAILLVQLWMLDGVLTDAAKLLRGLPSFLFGALLFKHSKRLASTRAAWALPGGLILLLALMSLGAPQLVTLAVVYLVATLAVAGDTGESLAPRWVRKLAPWGSLTYSLYMWHPLFILVVMNALGDSCCISRPCR